MTRIWVSCYHDTNNVIIGDDGSLGANYVDGNDERWSVSMKEAFHEKLTFLVSAVELMARVLMNSNQILTMLIATKYRMCFHAFALLEMTLKKMTSLRAFDSP